MIKFNEPKQKDLEIFKQSLESLCQSCEFINRVCANKVFITCGTDTKIGLAFVERCDQYEEKKC